MYTTKMSKILITIACVLVLLSHQQECFILKALNLTKNQVNHSPAEHGNLATLGRDVVRNTSKTLLKLGDRIISTFSKRTQGPDSTKNTTMEGFKKGIRAIYPGTKWCGDGDIAQSRQDLGLFSRTDSCCRAHDGCPEGIPVDSEKYGLVNTGLFTRSHCDCDKEFYDCLKNAKSVVASKIGFTFFTILGPQCFRNDYPIVACEKWRKGRCEKYVVDRTKPKMYQWFDSPCF